MDIYKCPKINSLFTFGKKAVTRKILIKLHIFYITTNDNITENLIVTVKKSNIQNIYYTKQLKENIPHYFHT